MLKLKTALLAGGVVLVGLLRVGTGNVALAQPQNTCYECNDGTGGDQGCQVCTRGTSGHISCIPYCNGTCSVGTTTGCGGQAFNSLHVAPDGTPDGFQVVEALASTSGGDNKNCVGFIELIQPTAAQGIADRTALSEIVL